jgi:hypothetical protein
MVKRRKLNAEVEKEADVASDMQDCFWDLFNVVEEVENRESSNYSSLPFTPVTINGKLVNALVDSGSNPSYVSTKWVKEMGLKTCKPIVPTIISRALWKRKQTVQGFEVHRDRYSV